MGRPRRAASTTRLHHRSASWVAAPPGPTDLHLFVHPAAGAGRATLAVRYNERLRDQILALLGPNSLEVADLASDPRGRGPRSETGPQCETGGPRRRAPAGAYSRSLRDNRSAPG